MRGNRWLPMMAAWTLSAMASVSVQAAASGPLPSAIGNEVVHGIAVSPLYATSGLVATMSVAVNCPNSSPDCIHLWISHDGGRAWARAQGKGWNHGIPTIAVGGGGREELIAPGSAGVQASDDDGDTWRTVGPGGTPSTLPTFAHDGGIAIAAGTAPDRLVSSRGTRDVRGSGGAFADMSFAFAPTYPSGGQHASALLSGIDTKASRYVVDRCDSSLSCGNPTTLGPAQSMGGAVQLQLSSDYADDGTVFASAMLLGITKSTDGGATFTPRPVGASGATVSEVTAMAVSPGYRESGPDRRVAAAVMQLAGSGKNEHTQGGIYESSDGATTWKALGTPGVFDNGASAVAMAPDGRVFGAYVADGGHAGLLCTVSGASWQTSCPPVGNWYASNVPSSVDGPSCAGPCAGPGTQGGSKVVAGNGGNAAASPRAGSGRGVVAATPAGVRPGTGSGLGGRLLIGFGALVLALLALALAALRRRRQW